MTQYNVFTDVSKFEGQTGSGVAVFRDKQEIINHWHRLLDYATVFQAEISAIAKAAEILCEQLSDRAGRSGLSTWKYQFSYDH